MRLQPLFVLIMIGSTTISSCAEDVAKKALDDARSYSKSGDYAKALERHEWFHKNALGIEPSYYGVRLSFALSDWMLFLRREPPTLNL